MLVDFHKTKEKAEKLTGDWRLRVNNFKYDSDTGIYSADVDSMSDAGIIYHPTLRKASPTELTLDCKCDGFVAKNICWHCLALVRTVLESKVAKLSPEDAIETLTQAQADAATLERDQKEEAKEVEVEVLDPEDEIPEEERTALSGHELVPVEHAEIVQYASAPSPQMTIEEFRKRTALIDQLSKELTEGTDYGKVPGIKNPFLYQPGAEKLQIGFNVVPLFTIIEKEVDHERLVPMSKWWKELDPQPEHAPENYQQLKKDGKMRCVCVEDEDGSKTFTYYEAVELKGGMSTGFYRFVIKCELRSRTNGAFVGEAMALCSSLETKYIRNARNAENTILQMAQKRASVRATRTALGLSDRFTQDPDIVKNQGQ